MANKFFLGIVLAAAAGLLIPLAVVGQNQVASQESTPMEMGEEMGKHLIDTETISLSGKLEKGDFKLLMDITPYMSEWGHIALKVPCGKDGEQLLSVLAGVAPNVKPVTLEYVKPLSNPPDSCVYHAELGEGITDIALANTSDKGVMFFGKSSGGYSATITIHGEMSEEPMMHQ
ncbi:MAG: hypothetical protein HMLIMOIP_002402 [Candidatus Nitrosomirales archaeon]|jgi:hypothetical protein